MPDDDRKRRRLGDETKGRIADLASGWDTPGESGSAPDPASAPRKKQKTLPPPPPGSVARQEIEDAIVDLAEESSVDIDIDVDDNDDDPDGWELPTVTNQNAAQVRARRPSQSRNGPTESGTVDVSGVIPEKTQPPELIVPVPTVDASALVPAPSSQPGTHTPRAGTRTSPPPPPGARVTGGAPVVPGGPSARVTGGAPVVPGGPGARATGGAPMVSGGPGARVTGGAPVVPGGPGAASGPLAAPASSSSGAFPVAGRSATSGAIPVAGRSATSGAIPVAGRSATSGAFPASSSGRLASISERLPLPADAAPPAKPTSIDPGPPTPPPGRAPRATFVVDDSGVETIPESSFTGLSVPVGEFDTAHTLPEMDRRRASYGPSTTARDAAGRGDPTSIEAAGDGSERGDPTIGFDQTGVHVGGTGGASKGRLRTIAQLRRKSGVGGDMRYVLTAIFGLRRARRELAELDAKQATRQQSRRRHLTTLGRTAVTADGFDHVALARARELLAGIEEERARHAGQVVAADAELQRVTRDREAKAKQYAADLEEIDAEIVDLTRKLEPLEKEIAGVTRRAADLRDAMRRIDEKIAFTEASLSSIDVEKDDRGAIQAEIASLKADRKSVQQDEPELASALDSLHPRIAKLEAARAEARRRRVELEQAEVEDQRRTEELLAAIGAKRKVVDRAAADAEAARDKIMFELGERLYVDRPESMSPELSPIDAIDVELGTGDRRMMELREILQSVDRMKIVRGVGLWILLLAALGGIAALALGVLPLPV